MCSIERSLDLLGHEDAWNFLWHSWNAGKLAHAWLIKGPQGIGKIKFSIKFALSLLGSNLPLQNQPQYIHYDHPNLLLIKKQNCEANKGLSWIKVSEIDKIKHFLNLTASDQGFKIVIIDEAETMSISATNALLKILESPPPQSLILLVTNCSGNLPLTIHSRCQQLTLRPLSTHQVETLLLRYRPSLEKTEAHTIAILSHGSIGLSLSLSDNGGIALYYTMLSLVKQAPSFNMLTLYTFSKVIAESNNMLFNAVGNLFQRLLILISISNIPKLNQVELVHGEEFLMLLSIYPDKIGEIWEEINYLFNHANRLALDYQKVILRAFNIIGTNLV